MSPYFSFVLSKIRTVFGPFGPILRDVLILTLLSALGGFIIGIAVGPKLNTNRSLLAAGVAEISLGIVGFTISGCLAPPPRWRHLTFVAIGTWLVGLNNVLWFGGTIGGWLSSSIIVALGMILGGGLSYLFKRTQQPPP